MRKDIEVQRDNENRYHLDKYAKSRDIAWTFDRYTNEYKESFPPISSIDWDRRDKAKDDLAFFLRTYFPQEIPLPFSDDHLKVIHHLEQCIKHGGLQAIAMPRGSGKTTIIERAAIWALVYGYRSFVSVVAATQTAAVSLLGHIKTELQFNPVLCQDFPTLCYPLQRLEGNSKRCVGQLYNGNRTLIEWKADKLTLPTVEREDNLCSGSTISAVGLTGNVRGQLHVTADGILLRPDFILLDDPQTRESSSSNPQTQTRYDLVTGDCLGLGGPDTTVSAVCCCTVIYKDDLSDKLLDTEKNAQWHGIKTKTIYHLPTNEKLWDEYRQLREDSFRRGGKGEEATEFYKQNKVAMDAGAVVSWKDRYDKKSELSAVQNAMNLKIRDEAAFWAEYQNEPQSKASEEQPIASVDEICERINQEKRYIIPPNHQTLTAYIDVQNSVLFYTVVAFQNDFTGAVVDYGCYPEQNRTYFTLKELKYTLQSFFPGASIEGQLYSGLEKLVEKLVETKWTESDGTARTIDRIVIDSGWKPDVIFQFCRQSQYKSILLPAKGVGITAKKKPFSEYKKNKGEVLAAHWRITKNRNARLFHIDTNYWKSFLHQKLKQSKGDKGSLTLWGDKPGIHKMIADHLTSETCVRVSTVERTVDEWEIKKNHMDNHFLDCVVGCYAAASLAGCKEYTPIASTINQKNVKKFARKPRRTGYIQAW